MDALPDEIGCRVHLAGSQVVDDRSGLLIGGVTSSTRRTDIPARYISISASSTELSHRR
jgi:hypothetical protein